MHFPTLLWFCKLIGWLPSPTSYRSKRWPFKDVVWLFVLFFVQGILRPQEFHVNFRDHPAVLAYPLTKFSCHWLWISFRLVSQPEIKKHRIETGRDAGMSGAHWRGPADQCAAISNDFLLLLKNEPNFVFKVKVYWKVFLEIWKSCWEKSNTQMGLSYERAIHTDFKNKKTVSWKGQISFPENQLTWHKMSLKWNLSVVS